MKSLWSVVVDFLIGCWHDFWPVLLAFLIGWACIGLSALTDRPWNKRSSQALFNTLYEEVEKDTGIF
jgi:hypothetical protein